MYTSINISPEIALVLPWCILATNLDVSLKVLG